MTEPVLHTKSQEISMDTGITRPDRLGLMEKLGVALADTYTLYLKTQGVHWNVTGPLFYSVHQLTEEQYRELFEAIDDIAERIRSLGFTAPASYIQFQKLTNLQEQTKIVTAAEMIRHLADDNETCARYLRQAVAVAKDAKDVKTADLLTERLGQHE